VLEVQHALQNSTLSAQHALLFWTQHISYNRQIYLITYMCNIHMFVATIRARKASTPLDAPPPPTPEHEAASQPLPCHSRRPHWPCISPARPCRHRPTRLPSRSPCHHRSSFTSEEAEDDSDDPDEDDSDAKSDYEREEIARRGGARRSTPPHHEREETVEHRITTSRWCEASQACAASPAANRQSSPRFRCPATATSTPRARGDGRKRGAWRSAPPPPHRRAMHNADAGPPGHATHPPPHAQGCRCSECSPR
jgi:hypothetical protein